MMETLKLEHLAPYLPYSLKFMAGNKKCNVAYMSTKKLALIKIGGYGGEVWKCAWGKLPKNVKPILRPLSDLTKEIKHNGNAFVPAHILHRIACEGLTNPFEKPNSGMWYEGKYQLQEFEDTGCQVITVETPDDLRESKLEICHSDGHVTFSKNLHNEERDSLIYACAEQMQLFQRLYEWHFDVFNLIEKGLAIDINKINQQPLNSRG